MKKTIIVFISVVTVCVLTAAGWSQPVATVDNPVYVFEAIPEGSHISHEFVVKNTGSTVLTVLTVVPP